MFSIAISNYLTIFTNLIYSCPKLLPYAENDIGLFDFLMTGAVS
jgi:hypothetical protein